MSELETSTPAKDRLLAAATELFSKKGFKGTSVREICDQAGTGNNMVHHYFGNKQGLLEAILARFNEEVFQVPVRIMQKLPSSSDEFVSRFRFFMEETLEALIAHRELLALIQKEPTLSSDQPFLIYTQQFIAFVEHGKQIGAVHEHIDASMLTGAIMDRLGNQVLYAESIKESTKDDIIGDAEFRARWLDANLNLFLYGFIKP